MKGLTLMLLVFTVSYHAYVLQPRATVTVIGFSEESLWNVETQGTVLESSLTADVQGSLTKEDKSRQEGELGDNEEEERVEEGSKAEGQDGENGSDGKGGIKQEEGYRGASVEEDRNEWDEKLDRDLREGENGEAMHRHSKEEDIQVELRADDTEETEIELRADDTEEKTETELRADDTEEKTEIEFRADDTEEKTEIEFRADDTEEKTEIELRADDAEKEETELRANDTEETEIELRADDTETETELRANDTEETEIDLRAEDTEDEGREEEGGASMQENNGMEGKTVIEGEEKALEEELRVGDQREIEERNDSNTIKTETLSTTPSSSLILLEDSSSLISTQNLDPLTTSLPVADIEAFTRPVSQSPATVGGSEEAVSSVVTETTSSEVIGHWYVTDNPEPRLREEEGLVPKAMEIKVLPVGGSTSMTSVTQKQRPKKQRSKVHQRESKAKKKETLSANSLKTKKNKQPKRDKAEEKGTSLKKDKNKDKNRTKKKNKKEKNSRKNETKLLHFPYFKDDYCPPDCACYGRVVQCSDKGVNQIPYGIPYNARYVLLMNNLISGIQLDLLREYVSLEFLVLSNNQLTDGGIEGAFEGMGQLKRLYLDKNLLSSIPTDLPASLEELRLDSNKVSVMSEVAWERCPGLHILSLNNNSLGDESVPEGVFAPLTQLRTLSLIHNHLTAAPLRLPANLREVYLRGNRMESIPGKTFSDGSDLLVLDLSANRLTNKGLAKDSLRPLVHLENLNLEGNLFRQIPRHLPPTLRTLNLEGNAISSVSKGAFLSLPHLEHLGLARNQITRVAPGAFWGLPVLHQLELGHNVLRQVPRRLPPSLRHVSLSHNKISSVPRDAFCAKDQAQSLSGLVQVHLEHNLIHLGDLDHQAFSCLRGYQVVRFY